MLSCLTYPFRSRPIRGSAQPLPPNAWRPRHKILTFLLAALSLFMVESPAKLLMAE